MMADSYLDTGLQQIDRLLSCMDRNKGSPTYGCLSRPYWHDKKTDFPSAHQQLGVFPLALAYVIDDTDNPYHGSQPLQESINASLRYWADIQKRNGSFDEHYPNEHSLGATAWTLWAVTETYRLLDDVPPIEDGIKNAVSFLTRYDEPGAIANHQAVAATALCNAADIVGKGREAARLRLEQLERMQHSEGWFREYVGADIGYQTTTLSHLGRIWDRNPDLVNRRMIEDGLSFLASFIDRENFYAGHIGSRHTHHFHPAGLERLTADFPEARHITYLCRKHLTEGQLLQPGQMDDKHFSRLSAELLDAYRQQGTVEETDRRAGDRDFETISIRRQGNDLWIVNTSKGGCYAYYREGRLQKREYGIHVRDGGTHYTATWPGATDEKHVEKDRIVVEGSLQTIPEHRFTGLKFLGSRIFQHTFGRSARISLWMKNSLIDRLIRGQDSGREFRRELRFDESLTVDDDVTGEQIAGKHRTIFVPSSEFIAGLEGRKTK